MPEQRERLRVLEGGGPLAAAESDLGDRARRAAKSAAKLRKVTSFGGLPKGLRKSFHDGMARTTPEMRAALRKVYRNADYIVESGARSYFHPGPGLNIILIGANADASTLVHELFHRMDVGGRVSQRFSESLMNDYLALNAASGGDVKQYLVSKFPNLFETNSLTGRTVFKEEYRGIADILNGFSVGKIDYGYGHPRNYWRTKGFLELEAWAQFGRIQFQNNKDVLNLFHILFPNFEKDAIIALKGLV